MTKRYRDLKLQAKADRIKSLLESDGVDEITIEKFTDWFFENQSTWKAFCELAYRAIQANKKFGAKAISEICRWQIEIEKNGEYKFNNNYTAYLARLFNANVKQEYFNTRDVRGLAA